MQKTRERILDYLTENHQATAGELSALLDLTGANVRHHLSVLERDGRVEVIGQTEPDGRGRPTLIYALTREAQPDGLAALARALLDELAATRSPAQLEARIARVAELLRAEAGDDARSITARLTAAAARMTELNYRAHWEAHAEGPQIILGNCPYAAIIDEHPELCHMDVALLTAIVGDDMSLDERFGRAVDDAKVCRFAIQSP